MWLYTMVLTSILKSPATVKMNNSNSPHVTFNLPDESIIQYLRNEEKSVSYSLKLSGFIKRITDPKTEEEVILKWIQDFKNNILLLENNERIVLSLLNLNWYARDAGFVREYQDFILNMVTAHPTYLKNVLSMILKVFATVQYSSNDEISDIEEKHFKNAHNLLHNTIKLVPLCESSLCGMINDKFPYMKSPTKVLLCYAQNLLYLSTYLGSRRLSILECIAEKVIYIDVNCPKSVIEMSEVQNQDENMLLDQDLSSECTNKDKMVHPLAHTMDVIIDAVYQYIYKTCFPVGKDKCDWEATKKLYKELLTVFDKIILPTHGSCHVQYIMFYICSFKTELFEGFVDYLWKKVQNPSIGPIYRQLASFYIGSFLTRAKYINISTVSACLSLMCHWIHSYIDNHTSQDLNVHGTFQSVCQTVFYVFAFRSQELLEADKGLKFMRSLNFDRIVTCRLNPLRYCDKTIVQNFANIARNFQIAYVYPVIEKNNRNLLYLNEEKRAAFCSGSMIEAFFPFDPYLLKKSKKWIEPIYRVYSHCQKEEELMDTVDEDATDICESLFTYGSSPGFKKPYLCKR